MENNLQTDETKQHQQEIYLADGPPGPKHYTAAQK